MDRINRIVQDLQDFYKILNFAYGNRAANDFLGTIYIQKTHFSILSILLILSILPAPQQT
jgi:hypothetical protein